MTADADSTARDAVAPLAASDRIVALDVLRGFALLGIFIMNMPGFSHSLFAAPGAPRSTTDALVAALRELLFAGKFNLLFGLVFGIGFALQMARLQAGGSARESPSGIAIGRADGPGRVYVRRLAFLFVVGLVHAMLLWSGDVLLIYAVLGLALLGLRRCDDRVFCALIAACLVFPAVAEVARPRLFGAGWDTVAAFEYQQLETSNDLAYGHGSFLDAVRETARIFDWSWRSPFGLFVWASFFVQMATGILVGYVLGRRGWPERPLVGPATERRAPATALLVAIGCGVIEAATSVVGGGDIGLFAAMLARTIGRAALAACYALAVVRLVRARPALPRWLVPLRDAGRMPLSNYLLQTLLASWIFFGWGLGRWNSTGPALEAALALALFVAVQLPFSHLWLRRFRQGPLEAAWRWLTYRRLA